MRRLVGIIRVRGRRWVCVLWYTCDLSRLYFLPHSKLLLPLQLSIETLISNKCCWAENWWAEIRFLQWINMHLWCWHGDLSHRASTWFSIAVLLLSATRCHCFCWKRSPETISHIALLLHHHYHHLLLFVTIFVSKKVNTRWLSTWQSCTSCNAFKLCGLHFATHHVSLPGGHGSLGLAATVPYNRCCHTVK